MDSDGSVLENAILPGILPALQGIQATLSSIQQTLALGQTLRASSSPAASATTGSSLPFGLTFDLALPLQRFNEIVGAMAYPGAAAVEIPLQAVIASGAVGQIVQYEIPEGYRGLAMSGFRGTFDYHSPDLSAIGWLNYGLAAPELITPEPVPITQDFDINRLVTGSVDITGNVTLLFNNLSVYDVRADFVATFLLVTEDTWQDLYVPIFREAQREWVDAIAANATAFLSTSQGGAAS